MNELINSKVSMTSVEIAELVGSQHGNVRISIERLAKRGVTQLPAMQKVENKQSFSQNKFTNAYIFEGEQGKRDSIIVVAQLCQEHNLEIKKTWDDRYGSVNLYPREAWEEIYPYINLPDECAVLLGEAKDEP